MEGLATRMVEHVGADIVIDSTADRCEALPGADYVITAVARHRTEPWEQDFRVLLSYGFRQCLGENGDPGALFHALRSFELTLPICADIRRLCPEALLLNFTNPEARALHAVSHLTKVKAVGICHGVSMAIDYIAKLLNRPADSLEATTAGVNHFYTLLNVIDKENGTDVLSECKQRVLRDRAPRWHRLFKELLEVCDVFTFPSDDHIGECLSFGTQYWGATYEWDSGDGRHKRVLPTFDDAGAVSSCGQSLETNGFLHHVAEADEALPRQATERQGRVQQNSAPPVHRSHECFHEPFHNWSLPESSIQPPGLSFICSSQCSKIRCMRSITSG
jgi:hypothetical protein